MIIFDLDGTLWDSAQSVAESWNIELERQLGRKTDFTREDILSIMGWTMDDIADKMMPADTIEEKRRLCRCCEEYENEYIVEHGAQLFDGVREVLAELKASGRKMAVVSNCQEGYIPAFMSSMDTAEFFCDYEEWGRTRTSKGANIRLVMERNGVDRAIYVGDIQKDKDACDEAQVPCIYAAYGFGEIENPAATIHSFRELPAVLEELGF